MIPRKAVVVLVALCLLAPPAAPDLAPPADGCTPCGSEAVTVVVVVTSPAGELPQSPRLRTS